MKGSQVLILLGLGAAVLLIGGVGVAYVLVTGQPPTVTPSPIGASPAAAAALVLPTISQGTQSPFPTYAYRPTFTPLPSPTGFLFRLPTPPPPTSPPANDSSTNSISMPPAQQPQPAPAKPASGYTAAYCSALRDYEAELHQYYLDVIDYIHAPMLNYYKQREFQLLGERDALGLVHLQQERDAELAQIQAEKSAENKRYNAEKAKLKATCQ